MVVSNSITGMNFCSDQCIKSFEFAYPKPRSPFHEEVHTR
ncbi:MAG: hypothetical protein JXB00_00455 [Bacteroidales bacterium]|nr:hypothetical protein [Bacteroidales bacterium]